MMNGDGLPTPQRYWAMAATWLAVVMAVLDASIANVALPAIARDLHAQAAESVWVVNAYQLAIVVSLLPLAALGEVVEYRRVFAAGLVVFILASLGCALARNLPELAVARAVQGLGASGVMAVNGALLRLTYPSRQLGRGVGLNALVVSLAAVIGPSVASAILSVASWPWLFAVNAPIGAAALLLGRRAWPVSLRITRPLDWPSTALNVLAFGLTVVGIDLLARSNHPAAGAALLVVGLGAGVALVRRSLRQARPLAPVDLMRSPLFSLTVLTSVLSFVAQMLSYVALPFFLQGALHRTQVETGLLVTPWPVAVGVAAPLAGRLADRYPAAILGGGGLAVLATGLALLALTPADASAWDIGWRMALCGLGFGFFQSPNNRTMLSAAPLDRSGAAGGMLATARLTGQTLGATLCAVLFGLGARGPVLAIGAAAGFATVGALVSLSRLASAPAAPTLAKPAARSAG
jgi:MFS transporter, DHA2 family, multidrug resistance protein